MIHMVCKNDESYMPLVEQCDDIYLISPNQQFYIGTKHVLRRKLHSYLKQCVAIKCMLIIIII